MLCLDQNSKVWLFQLFQTWTPWLKQAVVATRPQFAIWCLVASTRLHQFVLVSRSEEFVMDIIKKGVETAVFMADAVDRAAEVVSSISMPWTAPFGISAIYPTNTVYVPVANQSVAEADFAQKSLPEKKTQNEFTYKSSLAKNISGKGVEAETGFKPKLVTKRKVESMLRQHKEEVAKNEESSGAGSNSSDYEESEAAASDDTDGSTEEEEYSVQQKRTKRRNEAPRKKKKVLKSRDASRIKGKGKSRSAPKKGKTVPFDRNCEDGGISCDDIDDDLFGFTVA